MKKIKLFISCEEAQLICDKMQYNEATFYEKFKLNLRLTWCKLTRTYSKKNRALTKAVKHSNIECLKAKERKGLIEAFEEELTDNSQ
jgi:hypothetical protein